LIRLHHGRRWQSAILMAKVLAVVLLATSPRAILAPTSSFNRAQESKRPKVPKNIVRSDPVQVSNLEKQGKSPPPPRSETSRQAVVGWLPPSPWARSVSLKAHSELSKPEYLKLFSGSSRPSHLDPPA
jgi:hypothetical protein